VPTLAPTRGSTVLLFRCGAVLAALPLEDVRETLRPLPLTAVEAAPAFVKGISVIRGLATVIIDGSRLLCGDGAASTTSPACRLITLRLVEHPVALAVDETLGIQEFADAAMTALPPLVGAARHGSIEQLARLDNQLWMLLRAGRVVDDLASRGFMVREAVE
jgi:purine-binding chemotaxis protein CheW